MLVERRTGGETSRVALVVVVLLAALLVGRLAGGSLDRLGALPLRSRRLVLLALLAQLLGVVGGGPAYPVGLAVSAALVVVFLARNRGVRGTGLIALGLLANALVVGANGAMPVSVDAAGRAGVSTQQLLTGRDARHEPADAQTRLRWLGDVVPVALPLRPEVVSPGDVLVAAGAAQLVVAGMLRPRRPVSRGSVPGPATRYLGNAEGRPRRALPPLLDAVSATPTSRLPTAARPWAWRRARAPVAPPLRDSC